MRLGYVQSEGRGAVDRALSALAPELMARGLRLGGVVQSNENCAETGRCDMDALVLPDGPVIRISQSLGREARGCKLDTSALEQASGLVAGRLSADLDLLIVNKFGKHEADGRGMRPVMAEALALGVPVLCGVGSRNFDMFAEFAGDLAEPVELDDMMAWVQAAVSPVEGNQATG